jgi:hypothetical protein
MVKEIWLGGYLLFSHMKLGHMMQYGIWVSWHMNWQACVLSKDETYLIAYGMFSLHEAC